MTVRDGPSGSSPRGRGTLDGGREYDYLVRFIPARAGNTVLDPGPRRPLPVHPRAGGEHGFGAVQEVGLDGSSPRGRGTPSDQRHRGRRDRFIPARAGNTLPARAPIPTRPVHPRAGGEHRITGQPWSRARGSSPRGRGTQAGIERALVDIRFIPARAGNTAPGARSSVGHPVHPRAGGEHPSQASAGVASTGSSPRGRGTLGPASVYPHSRPVHPRAGGEHREAHGRLLPGRGSSPRGRGTQRLRVERQPGERFIPARAGNTLDDGVRANVAPVHPRAGGEHIRSR